MPWHVVEHSARCPSSRPFAVVKDDDGAVEGCHATREEADRQLAALYASEPQVAAAGCGCNRPDVGTVRTSAVTTAPMATAFPVPEYPPVEWFEGPPSWVPEWRSANGLEVGLDEQSGEDRSLRLTVTDDGRVGGWFFQKGVCLVDGSDECWLPPPSATGYAMFHQQDVVVDGGQVVKVGVIGNVGGHASPFVGPATAQKHYADPSAQLIVCRAGDDEIGGWIAGAMVPGATYADVALVRRCALSGDWRPMQPEWFQFAGVAPTDPIGYDCVGPTLVNRPGLPLIQKFARVASAPVYLGGMGGVQLDEEEPEMIVRLADGSTVELSTTEVAEAVMAHIEARTAAPEDVAPEGEPPAGGDTAVADLQVRVETVESQVAELQAVVGNVVAFMEDSMAQQMAAIDAAVVPLPEPAEEPVLEPAAS